MVDVSNKTIEKLFFEQIRELSVENGKDAEGWIKD